MTQLMVGAFYNPHLGRELAGATGIDHLAMADPPAASDPWWPAIRGRYTLLLHDYLGQLSEPLDERSIQRARRAVPLPLGRGAFPVPSHRGRTLQPELRVSAALHGRVPRSLRPQRLRAQGAPRPAARHGEHPRVFRRPGEPDVGADLAAPLLRGDGHRLPARSAARLAPGALPQHGAGALARRIPARARGGAARRRSEEHTSELQSRFDLVCR